jgi:hypothetical protein
MSVALQKEVEKKKKAWTKKKRTSSKEFTKKFF